MEILALFWVLMQAPEIPTEKEKPFELILEIQPTKEKIKCFQLDKRER